MSSDRFDTNEWRKNSMKGLVCGIMLCRNSPIKQCSRCLFHYCSEHVKTHFHPTSATAATD
jgi:hypothetical protein